MNGFDWDCDGFYWVLLIAKLVLGSSFFRGASIEILYRSLSLPLDWRDSFDSTKINPTKMGEDNRIKKKKPEWFSSSNYRFVGFFLKFTGAIRVRAGCHNVFLLIILFLFFQTRL